MILRDAQKVIQKFATYYPCVSINGPRQSGKSTLARETFPDLPYISFENIDTREAALRDIRGFLDHYKDGAIFDEVQQAPEILSYLQQVVDEDQRTGRYVLTGSQNLLFMNHVSQSLAGRVGIVTLLPLSHSELTSHAPATLAQAVFTGGYPRMHIKDIEPYHFFSHYMQTYVERDVRQIKNIEKIDLFQRFIRLCAGRIGQLVNYSSLAADCGISSVTAQEWLSILQASYVVFLVPPYHKNFNKRIIKSPKLYFYDTGLASFLLGIESPDRVSIDRQWGHLVENYFILELMKHRMNSGKDHTLYFWRDQAGLEVDIVCDWGGILKAIEVKSTQTFSSEFLKGVQQFNSLAKAEAETQCFVLYPGEQRYTIHETTVLPFNSIKELT